MFSNLPIHDKPSAAPFFVSGLSDDEWGNVTRLSFLGRSVGWSIYIVSTVTKFFCVANIGTKMTPSALSCEIFWRHLLMIEKGGKA